MTEIYYARHVNSWPKDGGTNQFTPEFFFNQKAIAIHFVKKESWDPEEYRGHRNQGPSAIRYMNLCNGDNGKKDILVFASYRIDKKLRVLMGRPRLGSKCFLSQHLGMAGVPEVKMLFLDEVREITPREFPYAFLLAPKQSTFVHWDQCELVINRWMENDSLKDRDLLEPKTYLPASIEVLCEEYLRRKGLLTRKLTRTGSNLKFFDIIGINPHRELVYAQVKERSTARIVKTFKQRCLALGPGHYFFFAEELESTRVSGVEIFSIQDVLKYFSENGEHPYLMILAKQAWPTRSFEEIGTPLSI